MAGLADLAAGMRLAGGVVSPGVFKTIAVEDEQRRELAQRMAMFQQQQALQRERLAVENASRQDARADRLTQFREGLVAKQAELQQRAADRMAELEARNASAAERMAANQQFQREMMGLRLQAQQDMARLAASMRQEPAPTVTEVMGPDGKPYKIDARSGRVIGQAPPSAASGGAGMSPEAAAKTELLVNGQKDVQRFRDLVIPKGKPDRTILAGMSVPGMAGVPGTDSRLAYSYIYNAIEAKLRAESGAAVPETEVKRMAKRFVPSPLDNDETIKSKVDRLEEFLSGSLGRVKGVKQATPPQSTNDDPLGIR